MIIALGNWIFRHRNWLFPLVFLLALLPGRPVREADGWSDMTRTAVAWVVALAGQALRMLTIGCDYIVRGGKDRRIVKEYNTTFCLVAAMVGLDLWGDYLAFGHAALPRPTVIWVSIVLWLTMYAAVRGAKKRGYLKA